MTFPVSIMIFAGVALATWLIGFAARGILLRADVVDRPTLHSSHDEPVPLGGGVPVALAFFGWFLFAPHGSLPASPWLAAGVGAVGLVSFLDDLKHLSRRLRLAVYALAALGFTLAFIQNADLPEFLPALLIFAMLWIWLTGFPNAFNFIDGINGLAASHAILIFVFGAGFCQLSAREGAGELVLFQLVLAGAMAGFLPHNFPKARVFLGDLGSITTGFLLAVTLVWAWWLCGWKTGVALFTLNLGVLLDPSITMIRRLLKGEIIYHRHRDFFFHRAIRAGRPHAFVTLTEAGIQTGAGVLLLLSLMFVRSEILFAGSCLTVVAGWIAFYIWCEREFWRHHATHSPEIHRH